MTTKTQTEFEINVRQGLSDYPKHLHSKFIYNKEGDELFKQIMELPEYYLTRAEYDILQQNKREICKQFYAKDGFDLIELGAGDGQKTKLILQELVDQKMDFDYLPIDISQNVLDDLEKNINEEIPEVDIKCQQGSYFDVLNGLANYNKRKKVILVLGSNIGNLLHKEAIDFLQQIQQSMGEFDMLFMGFDQKKHPQMIVDAYNDSQGVTEAFNKNLLKRINNEFNANFDLDQFLHWESYDPETGTAKSFLISKIDQQVDIKALNMQVDFYQWETIHTEISQKYTDDVVSWLVNQAKLEIDTHFTDQQKRYKNYIFKIG
jgi:dimethylhistidine N-methyltransferase